MRSRRKTHRLRRGSLLIWLWLATGFLCWGSRMAAGQPQPGGPAEADTQAVQALTQRFFDAYQKRDVAGFLGLWETASPRYAARAAATSARFAAEEYAFGSVTGNRINWTPGFSWNGTSYQRQAIMYLDVTFSRRPLPAASHGAASVISAGSAAAPATAPSGQDPEGAPFPPPQRVKRCLILVERAGEWRVWNYESPADLVAEELVQISSAAQRRQALPHLLAMAPWQIGLGLLHLAAEHSNRSDDRLALIFYDAARVSFGRTGDSFDAAQAVCGAGEIYLSEKDYGRAGQSFDAAIPLLEQATREGGSYRNWLDYVHDRRGLVFEGQHHDHEAVLAFDEAEDGYHQSHDWGSLAADETQIGQIYRWNQPTLALPHLQEACRFYGSRLETTESADARRDLGQCYLSLDRFREAQQAIQIAADQYRSLFLGRQEADAHCALGRVFLAQGAQHLALDELGPAKRQYQYPLGRGNLSQQERIPLAGRPGDGAGVAGPRPSGRASAGAGACGPVDGVVPVS